jgi:O-antigen ligase
MLFKKFDITVALFCLLIISFIVGSAVLNITVVVISIFYLFKNFKNKKFDEFEIIWVKAFLVFWIYLILISFFSEDYLSSIRSSFSQIRYLFLILFIYKYLNFQILKFIIYFLTSLLFFVSIDNNIQFFTGLDIFGYQAEGYIFDERIYNLNTNNYYVGRLSGPFGNELVTGAFIAKLSFPLIFYFMQLFKKVKNIYKFLIICLFVILIEGVIISGERTSSLLIILAFFLAFYSSYGFKKTLLISLPIFLSLVILINSNDFLKKRSEDTVKIVKNIPDSSYGRLYSAGINIWKENLIFGVGLKNYRIECNNIIDPEPNHTFPFCATHPHNVILEFLSEAGLMGLFLFLVFLFLFIKNFFHNYKKEKNSDYKFICLGSFTMIILSIIPLYPSGSFFSSWNSTFFWINFGFAASLINREKLIKI